MTENEQQQWQQIQNEIYKAFEDVKLEDGIGYYEAGAIDDYLKPDDAAYIEEKARDERDDWRNMLLTFSDKDLDYCRHCFMDARGLLFYLPFLMSRRSDIVNHLALWALRDIYYKDKRIEKEIQQQFVFFLTKEQKKCLLHYYQFLTAISDPDDFWQESLRIDLKFEDEMKGIDFITFMKEHFEAD